MIYGKLNKNLTRKKKRREKKTKESILCCDKQWWSTFSNFKGQSATTQHHIKSKLSMISILLLTVYFNGLNYLQLLEKLMGVAFKKWKKLYF